MEISDQALRNTALYRIGGWAEKKALLERGNYTLAEKLVVRPAGARVQTWLVQEDGAEGPPFDITINEFCDMSPDEFLLWLLGTWVATQRSADSGKARSPVGRN